jgi:hypothetical protein
MQRPAAISVADFSQSSRTFKHLMGRCRPSDSVPVVEHRYHFPARPRGVLIEVARTCWVPRRAMEYDPLAVIPRTDIEDVT